MTCIRSTEPQGIIDYEGAEYYGDELVPWRMKYHSAVSCLRVVFFADGVLTWHAPMQLTTGRRDFQ